MSLLANVIRCLFVIITCLSYSISDKVKRLFPDNPGGYMSLPQGVKILRDRPRLSNLLLPSEYRQKEEQVKEILQKLNKTYVRDTTWPIGKRSLGAVSSVTFDIYGNVVIFHRDDRIWNGDTFTIDAVYTQQNREPIKNSTIIGYNRKTGQILYEFGRNIFHMPHGLTIDHENNVWVTDVALHQVMKFGPNGSNDNPLMVLGTKFKPGHGNKTFCKPTSVAVLPNGDFFVADGYCNARIIKYSKNGEVILTWGKNVFSGKSQSPAQKNYFSIPHKLTLAMDLGLVCVADRENGRVQCFYSTNGTFHSQYHSPLIGDRLFSVSYSPVKGGLLFVVNGPESLITYDNNENYHEISGFVIEMSTGNVLSKFAPLNGLHNPHDLIVSKDGYDVYVADLDPPVIYKFLNSEMMQQQSVQQPTQKLYDSNTNISSLNVKPTATLDDPSEPLVTSQEAITPKVEPGATALLIISSIVVFIILIFGLALLISKRRKRGCMPFGVRNRRHAWDFPQVKTGDFKLGNLLDKRKKRGFEKLDQDASDEEPNDSTNMLSSAQFA